MTRNNDQIINFSELLSEILWNWQPSSAQDHHHIHRDKDAVSVDKLYITPEFAEYKMEHWKLEPGVWEKLNTLLDTLEPLMGPPRYEIWLHYEGDETQGSVHNKVAEVDSMGEAVRYIEKRHEDGRFHAERYEIIRTTK